MNTVSCDVTPCTLMKVYKRFEGMWVVCLQGKRVFYYSAGIVNSLRTIPDMPRLILLHLYFISLQVTYISNTTSLKKANGQEAWDATHPSDVWLYILVFIIPRPFQGNSSRPTRVVIRYMRGMSSDPWSPISFISPWHSLVFRYKTAYKVAPHWSCSFHDL
jgi:hypothetical protein